MTTSAFRALALATLFTSLLAAQSGHAVLEPVLEFQSSDPEDVTAGDLNGNGKIELVVAQGPGQGPTQIWRAQSDGSYALTNAIPDSLYIRNHQLVHLDHDGDLDLLEQAGTSVRVRLGGPLVSFAAPVEVLGGLDTLYSHVADVNADTHADLLIGSAGGAGVPGHGVHVFLGAGDGSFSAGPMLVDAAGARWVSSGLLDGDDLVDVVWASYQPADLKLALGTGGGAFGPPTTVAPLNLSLISGIRTEHFALADLDGDTTLDLVWIDLLNDMLRAHGGQGDGTFAAEVASPTPPVGEFNTWLRVGDLTRDGTPDVWLSSRTDEHGAVMAGDGALGFTPSLLVDGLPNPAQPLLRDLDADGDLDVVVIDGQFLGLIRLLVNHTYGPGSAFVDLGGALAGTAAGLPILLADGAPEYGEEIAFALHEAAPSTLCGLVLGLSRLDGGFKGGVMLPFPDEILGPVPTGVEGSLVLAETWPALLGGWSFWAQWWIADGSGPHGFTSSTAVRADVP
jgi:hypothetical protein